MDVKEYICGDGSCPYRKWFDGLDALAAAKVAVAVYRLSEGHTAAYKRRKKAGE